MKQSTNPFSRGYLSFDIRRISRGHAIVQSISGKRCDGGFSHIGDCYSYKAAQAVVRDLQFETGFYSRCWEISTAHITESAYLYLHELTQADSPPELLFVAFQIPHSPAIGVKLISTPWTDEHLAYTEGMSVERLRLEHGMKGVPASLAQVLHLAAQADVRMLVFDGDAPELPGLPIYEETNTCTR
jgi:hypothetical protein